MSSSPTSAHTLHSGMFNATLRHWQTTGCHITPDNLMYPLFLIPDSSNSSGSSCGGAGDSPFPVVQPIESMPGVSRYNLAALREHLAPLVARGLSSVLLFGVLPEHDSNGKPTKDATGTSADSNDNPVMQALPRLREWFPELTLACDVCLCPYTDHGHCGIIGPNGIIDNDRSIKRLVEISVAYATAGAHIVGPSDMMDGRIGAIKAGLKLHGVGNRVAVLSYAVKFASSFYGPFRDAAKSAPAFGDRKCYQLPSGSKGLALRAAARDVAEGADMLMVKPGLAYLDLVRQTKDKFPEYPLFIYQVSGEYAMLYHAAKAGALNLRAAVEETLLSMRRAGADVIITYYTPQILEWLENK